MIGIYLGEQSEGKTLSMTARLYEAYLLGYEIYSNYNLKFPHKKISKELIEEWTKEKKQFNKTIFGIDEIYLLFDSRNFNTKKNKIFSYFILQTSKRDVTLLGTAQYFNTIEKRLRENVKFKCFCNRAIFDEKQNKFIALESNSRIQNSIINNKLFIRNHYFIKCRDKNNLPITKQKINYVKASKIFNIYDTRELIDID